MWSSRLSLYPGLCGTSFATPSCYRPSYSSWPTRFCVKLETPIVPYLTNTFSSSFYLQWFVQNINLSLPRLGFQLERSSLLWNLLRFVFKSSKFKLSKYFIENHFFIWWCLKLVKVRFEKFKVYIVKILYWKLFLHMIWWCYRLAFLGQQWRCWHYPWSLSRWSSLSFSAGWSWGQSWWWDNHENNWGNNI